jgi:hypothetical protein
MDSPRLQSLERATFKLAVGGAMGSEPVFRERVTRIRPPEVTQERTGRPKPATGYVFRARVKYRAQLRFQC